MRKFASFLLLATVAAVLSAEQSALYYYDQAKALEKSGDSIRAADMARESLRRNGDHVPSLVLLSRILSASLDLKAAEALVMRALRLDAQNDEAAVLCARIELGLKNMQAFENCLAITEKKQRLNADAMSLRAQVLIDNGNYALARRKIMGILRDFPGHTETHLRLAALYLKLKQFEKAEQQFRKIQALLPDNSQIGVAIARARLDAVFQNAEVSPQSDAAVRALEALRHAFSNTPDNLAVNLMLAQFLALTERCGDAREYLQKLAQSQSDSRPIAAFYALCDSALGGEYLKEYLKRNEDDEIARHQSELLQLSLNKKREYNAATQAARYHRKIAMRAMRENVDDIALAALRWSEFLFPGYVEAHRDLLKYFRVKKDFERMADELVFLRDSTQGKEYREMYEQLESERGRLWYVTEGVATPEREKNLTPVHIYPFAAREPLSDHPLGGVAIADRTRVALQNYGRVRSISHEMAALPQAQKFSAENLRRLRQTYGEALRTEGNPHAFHRKPLGYALAGSFSELLHGVEVNAEIIDGESGIRVAATQFKAEGRGYLNKAAVRLAQFVYANAPVTGNILKLRGDTGVLINLGKRDGVSKDAKFAVVDRLGRTIVFKALRRDADILEAASDQGDALRHLKTGDVVRLAPKNN